MENSMTVPQKKKLKIEIPEDPAIIFQGIYWKKMKTLIQKDICTPISMITIYNGQDKEATNLLMASLKAQMVKNLPANAGDPGSTPGLGRPLEKETATHSSILAWKIPMDREPWWVTVHGAAKSRTLSG